MTTPIATSHPRLEVKVASSGIFQKVSKPTSIDTTTIIVDKDESWESENLESTEEPVSCYWNELDSVYDNGITGGDGEDFQIEQGEEVRRRRWNAGEEVRSLPCNVISIWD